MLDAQKRQSLQNNDRLDDTKRVGEALVRDVRTTLVHMDSKRSSSACCQGSALPARYFRLLTQLSLRVDFKPSTCSTWFEAPGPPHPGDLEPTFKSTIFKSSSSSMGPGYQKKPHTALIFGTDTVSVSTQASPRDPAASLLRACTIMVTCP